MNILTRFVTYLWNDPRCVWSSSPVGGHALQLCFDWGHSLMSTIAFLTIIVVLITVGWLLV